MLFVIYHIYIYTHTHTLYYIIYIYRFIGKVNFQLDEILANPSYLVVPFVLQVILEVSRSDDFCRTSKYPWFEDRSSLEKPTCPIMIALNMGNRLEYVILRHTSFIQAYIVIVKHVKPYQTSSKRLDPLNPL